MPGAHCCVALGNTLTASIIVFALLLPQRLEIRGLAVHVLSPSLLAELYSTKIKVIVLNDKLDKDCYSQKHK